MSKKELQNTTSALPTYLQNNDKGSRLRGLDASDFIIPRIILLQGLSPQLEAYDEAKIGHFWHNVNNVSLGNKLRFIIVNNTKRGLLMAPRQDGRGILARCDDMVHWSPAGVDFDVQLPNNGPKVRWSTKETEKEAKLLQFGTSNPSDPNSPPAAVLFYEYLVMLPDHPELGLVLLSLGRTSAKKAKDLNSKVEGVSAPMQSIIFQAESFKDKNQKGEYQNWNFLRDGWASEEQFNQAVEHYERTKDIDVRGADEEGEAAAQQDEVAKTGVKEDAAY